MELIHPDNHVSLFHDYKYTYKLFVQTISKFGFIVKSDEISIIEIFNSNKYSYSSFVISKDFCLIIHFIFIVNKS
jgi:hypothetical protein